MHTANRLAEFSFLLALIFTRPARGDIALVPSDQGYFGAWLLAGPLRGAVAQATDIDAALPALNAPLSHAPWVRFRLLASKAAVDLVTQLPVTPQDGAYALAAGWISLAQDLDGWLLVSADGGVAVSVDGTTRFKRDVARIRGRSWDAIPLRLDKGRHKLVLWLHQYGKHWAFEARVLECATLLPPRDMRWVLPEAGPQEGEALAASMLSLEVDSGLDARAYYPHLELAYARGVPESAPLEVVTTGRLNGRVTFETRLGRMVVGARGVEPLEAVLPPVQATILDEGARRFELGVTIGTMNRSATLHLSRRDIALAGRSEAWLERLRAKRVPDGWDAETLATTLEARLEKIRKAALMEQPWELSQDETRLEELLKLLDAGRDPAREPGILDLYRASTLDGSPQPISVHVPTGYRAGADRRYPLVVLLHGYNGTPRSVLTAFLGSAGSSPSAGVDGFVVAPFAHGNTFYRGPGEQSVLDTLDWVLRTYPIDSERVSISGVSMGGTGAARIGLMYADRFAAAAPLCGYHSYFLGRDLKGLELRPWEQALAHHWSSASWAERGRNLPLYVAQGTKDFPLENSRVLVRRYQDLGYAVEQEWPDIGHNVWEVAYAGGRMWPWLTRHHHQTNPKHVSVKTDSLRYGSLSWVHITGLEHPGSMSELDAMVTDPSTVVLRASGVEALSLDRPAALSGRELQIEANGERLTFEAMEAVKLYRESGRWHKGERQSNPQRKRPGLEGPIFDVFQGPLVVVYGTVDPAFTRANREVAEVLAGFELGSEVALPVVADRDFDVAQASDRSWVLVGSPKSNRVLGALAQSLPIQLDGDAIAVGLRRYFGAGVGATFVYPNPKNGHYLLVVLAPSAAGIWRALSVPRLLPDFFVYDDSVANTPSPQVLGPARALAAGFFNNDWSLPKNFDDPRSKTP